MPNKSKTNEFKSKIADHSMKLMTGKQTFWTQKENENKHQHFPHSLPGKYF